MESEGPRINDTNITEKGREDGVCVCIAVLLCWGDRLGFAGMEMIAGQVLVVVSLCCVEVCTKAFCYFTSQFYRYK